MEKRLVTDYDFLLPWKKYKWLSSGVKLYLGDNKEFSLQYDPALQSFVLVDETTGVNLMILNKGTDIIQFLNVMSGTVSSKNPLLKKSASPTVAPSGTTPTEVNVLPLDANHFQVIPIGGSITGGGTFGTNETVTVTIIAHYSDGTTGSITKTLTSATTVDLTLSDIVNLIKDGVYIVSVGAKAQSSLTATSATVTVTLAGMYG